jgi:hypothetical protein
MAECCQESEGTRRRISIQISNSLIGWLGELGQSQGQIFEPMQGLEKCSCTMPCKKSGKSRQCEWSGTPPLVRAAQDFLITNIFLSTASGLPTMGISEGENMQAVFVEGPKLTNPNRGWLLPLHEPWEGH